MASSASLLWPRRLSPGLLRSRNAIDSLARTRLVRGYVTGSPPPASDDRVLLHHSPLPTYWFQRSLPKLPLPTLEASLDKYKYYTRPLVADDVYHSLLEDVEAFRTGPGPELQRVLTEWDKAHGDTSFISELWYDYYLRDRSPLVLSQNPQLTMRDDPVPSKMEQPVRATDVVHAAARFLLTLEAQALPPDVYWGLSKPAARDPNVQRLLATVVPERWAYYPFYMLQAYPLDMSQYHRLFRSTRLPKAGKDELWTAPERTRHIIVQRGSAFYKLNVLNAAADAPLPPREIEAALRVILADSPSVGAPSGGYSQSSATLQALYPEPPVGALTGAGRDEWAAAHSSLAAASPRNRANLADIDSALFTLTLDHASPANHEQLSRAMLHGDGRNRWFDKCFNLIVTANGRAGINWEHAWGDGVAILYFFNEVYKASVAAPPRHPQSIPSTAIVDWCSHLTAGTGPAGVTPLVWDLEGVCPDVVAAIRAAEARFDAVIAGTDLRVYQTDSLTKEDVKRSKLSPDGVMQMALQLAHNRAHGYTPSTYESASTAGFKHGRTETIRSATPESALLCKQFGRAAGSEGVGREAQLLRYRLLYAATARHGKTARDAALGNGFDRHLFALGVWAAKLGLGQPSRGGLPLFSHPGHAIFKDIRLSTSTLESPALEGGGFGPVSPTSYGVGYGIEERGAHFHIMNHSDAVAASASAASAAAASLSEGSGSGSGGGRQYDPTRVPGSHPPCDGHAFAAAVEGALTDIRECIAVAQAAGLIDEMASAAASRKR